MTHATDSCLFRRVPTNRAIFVDCWCSSNMPTFLILNLKLALKVILNSYKASEVNLLDIYEFLCLAGIITDHTNKFLFLKQKIR